MRETSPRRCARQAGEQRPRARGQRRILIPARRVALAVGDELVQRALCIAGEEEGQSHVRRRHAIEDDGPHVRAVPAEVDQRCPRAVGPAVQVDRPVAEVRPHVLEIVHGDGRRVEAGIGVAARRGNAAAAPRPPHRIHSGHGANRGRTGTPADSICRCRADRPGRCRGGSGCVGRAAQPRRPSGRRPARGRRRGKTAGRGARRCQAPAGRRSSGQSSAPAAPADPRRPAACRSRHRSDLRRSHRDADDRVRWRPAPGNSRRRAGAD